MVINTILSQTDDYHYYVLWNLKLKGNNVLILWQSSIFLPVNNENVFLKWKKKDITSFKKLLGYFGSFLLFFWLYFYLRQVKPLDFIFFLYLNFPVLEGEWSNLYRAPAHFPFSISSLTFSHCSVRLCSREGTQLLVYNIYSWFWFIILKYINIYRKEEAGYFLSFVCFSEGEIERMNH